MDCNMPVLNGYDTTKKIIDLCNSKKVLVPYIVALTAHSETNQDVVDQCMLAGMQQVRSKPIKSEKIRALLD